MPSPARPVARLSDAYELVVDVDHPGLPVTAVGLRIGDGYDALSLLGDRIDWSRELTPTSADFAIFSAAIFDALLTGRNTQIPLRTWRRHRGWSIDCWGADGERLPRLTVLAPLRQWLGSSPDRELGERRMTLADEAPIAAVAGTHQSES